MQVLKFAGCAGVATGSILVYAYILMYYTKNRGFENQRFFSGGFRDGGYLKAEREGVAKVGPFSPTAPPRSALRYEIFGLTPLRI